jgi:hypothetical protein
MATISKTEDVVMLSHVAITHPDSKVGDEVDVSTKLGAAIVCYHALVEVAANTNPGSFRVQASPSSSGEEDWVDLAFFTTKVTTPDTEAIIDTYASGVSYVSVVSTTGFVALDELYIQDSGVVADGEWAICREIVSDDKIVFIDGLNKTKDNADVVWNDAEKFVAQLDLTPWSRVRAIFMHEGSAGANVHIKSIMTTGDSIG